MTFTKKHWEEAVEGYDIEDCVFIKPDRHAFILQKYDDDAPDELITRMLVTFTENGREKPPYYGTHFAHFRQAKIAFGNSPQLEVVVSDLKGHIYSYSIEHVGEEDDHPIVPQKSVITDIARIGSSIYTVGSPRNLYRRGGKNKWEELTQDLAIPSDYLEGNASIFKYGWNSVSGFSESDIYVAGGEGDVWNYDGENWHDCQFPSDVSVYKVCCAGNGKVYVGARDGELWEGRNKEWRKIPHANFAIGHDFMVDWLDIVWFKGRLLLSTSFTLWELIDDKIVKVNRPLGITGIGHLDVSDDGNYLLTAYGHSASVYDGDNWEVIFNSNLS